MLRPQVLAVAFLVNAGCVTTLPTPSANIDEARAFMAAYAEDLREHDRAGLIARYDPQGTWFVIGGKRWFDTHDKVRQAYSTEWTGPAGFMWHDLHYEQVGNDTIMVLGEFDWGTAGGPRRHSYTGLLVRRDGQWRIRLENELPVGK